MMRRSLAILSMLLNRIPTMRRSQATLTMLLSRILMMRRSLAALTMFLNRTLTTLRNRCGPGRIAGAVMPGMSGDFPKD